MMSMFELIQFRDCRGRSSTGDMLLIVAKGALLLDMIANLRVHLYMMAIAVCPPFFEICKFLTKYGKAWIQGFLARMVYPHATKNNPQ